MAAYNMSNVHISPDVLSTVLLLQENIMHDISRNSRPEVICKKAVLKTTQNT